MIQNILQKIFPKQFGEDVFNQNQQKAQEIIIKAEQDALKVKQEAAAEARKTVNEALEIEKRLAKKESVPLWKTRRSSWKALKKSLKKSESRFL